MKKILLLVVVLFVNIGVDAQIDHPVTWAYGAKTGNTTATTLFLKVTIQPGWHIYAIDNKGGSPLKTTIAFTKSDRYALIGDITEPKPVIKFEKALKTNVAYFENEVIFKQKIKIKSTRFLDLKGTLEYVACNSTRCNPPEDVNFSIPLGK